MCSVWSSGEPCLALGKKQLSCSVAHGIFPDKGSYFNLLHCQVESLPLSYQGSPWVFFFFFFFEFTSSNRCVVLICNFLMIYDFWVFLICLFSICMFSLARCSDLYIFNEAVCSRFFGIIWVYNVLSDMFFVDIFLCLWLVAGVQPRLIQGIRRRGGFGDLCIYLFIKDIKSNRMRIAQ